MSENGQNTSKKRALADSSQTINGTKTSATPVSATDASSMQPSNKKSRILRSNPDGGFLSPTPPDIYPETLSSFADGIRGDLFEIFTGLHKTFKVLLPFVNHNQQQGLADGNIDEEASLRDLALPSGTPASTPAAGKPSPAPSSSSSQNVKYSSSQADDQARKHQVAGALRMRCSTLWNEKDNIDPSKLLSASATANSQSFSTTTSTSSKDTSNKIPQPQQHTRVKEGGKIQLSKLANPNSSLTHFPACDNCMVIIGHSRLVYVRKELPADGKQEGSEAATAVVIWTAAVHTIESLTVSFEGDSVRLELLQRGKGESGGSGDGRVMRFPDFASCTQVLQLIQKRRDEFDDSNVTSSSSSSTSGAAVENSLDKANSQVTLPTISTSTPSKHSTVCVSDAIHHTPTSLTSIQRSDEEILHNGAGRDIKETTDIISTCTNKDSSVSTNDSKDSHRNVMNDSEDVKAHGSVLLLTPVSCKRVDLIARQLRHGVGECGLRDKLVLDGLSGEDAATTIDRAKRVVEGAKVAVVMECGTDLNNMSLPSKNDLKKLDSELSTKPTASASLTVDKMKVDDDSKEVSSSNQSVELSSNSHVSTSSLQNVASLLKSRIMNETNTSTQTPSSNPPSSSNTSLPPHLLKFSLMLKNGVPLPAVQCKMNVENVSKEDQALVLGGSSTSSSASSSSGAPSVAVSTASLPPSSSTTLPPHLLKFSLMLKNGVPLPAVQCKMNVENVSKEDQALVLGGSSTLSSTSSSSGAPSIPPSSSTNSNTSLPPHLLKFSLMLKNGVPLPAVQCKMNVENVSKEDQALVLGGSSTLSSTSTSSDAVSNNASTKDTPKLLNLHWEPLKSVSDQSNTVWGSLQSGPILDLKEDEYGQLAGLFHRKDTSASATSSSSSSAAAASTSSSSQSNSSRPKPLYLESSKCTNISICLASFKSRGLLPQHVAFAIECVNTHLLSYEDCLKIRDVLPADKEVAEVGIKVSAKMGGKEGGKQADGKSLELSSLHEAEQLVYYISLITGYRQKLNTLIFLGQAIGSIENLSKSLSILREGAGRVMLSQSLRCILTHVLNIGNALNRGSWKGGAQGFKLSGLSKLQQTKASDGKTTLTDYLVQVLVSRSEGGGGGRDGGKENEIKEGADAIMSPAGGGGGGAKYCQLALCIDEELQIVKQARAISLTDILKDVDMLQKEGDVAIATVATLARSQPPTEPDSLPPSLQHVSSFATNLSHLKGLCVNLEGRIRSLASLAEATKTKCEDMSNYFSEDSSAVVFTALSDFLVDFAAAKKKQQLAAKKLQSTPSTSVSAIASTSTPSTSTPSSSSVAKGSVKVLGSRVKTCLSVNGTGTPAKKPRMEE